MSDAFDAEGLAAELSCELHEEEPSLWRSELRQALQRAYDAGKACGEAENVLLRAVAVTALAAYKSPGYPEHAKLYEALSAAGLR